MADTPTEQALAISTGIIGALHAAGVLHPAGMVEAQATSTPPPQPELQVGQFVNVLIRYFAMLTKADQPITVSLTQADAPITYDVELPPNDEIYLPEFRRLQTIDRTIQITAQLKITSQVNATAYHCELRGLWAGTGFRY